MRQHNQEDDQARLPTYARSLLKIKVPVSVTLAASKQPIGRVVELTPGSIIQFEKACDEMLCLEVGGCDVAEGEAVKVGDKFGLRVTSITLPEERFTSLRKSGESATSSSQAGQTPADVPATETDNETRDLSLAYASGFHFPAFQLSAQLLSLR